MGSTESESEVAVAADIPTFEQKLASLRHQRVNVGPDGFVMLVDGMGGEDAIVQAARVSYGAGTKSVSDDRTLIRYLMRHRHTTPSEMCVLKFHLRVPMDVMRQLVRHRVASINEYSTRYSEAIDSRATTKPDEWRLQATTNKQGSDGVVTEWPAGVQPTPYGHTGRVEIAGVSMPYTMPVQLLGTEDSVTPGEYLSEIEERLHAITDGVYRERLRFGVAREQARKDLPLSTYTELYWKMDLHNLLHFLGLRMDSHAQLEIRQFANAIYDIVKQLYPNVAQAFEDYRLNAVTLTGPELQLLPRVIDWLYGQAAPATVTSTDLWLFAVSFATCPDDWRNATKLPREVIEFHGKLVKMGLVAA
jgi:thymidylate synthase (FAD)